jgi:para-aminobenzoate synthetase component I
MRSLVIEQKHWTVPESLLDPLRDVSGVMLLRSGTFDPVQGRYSLLVARPFLTFRAFGTRCELGIGNQRIEQYGNPWLILEQLIDRFELPDELDQPFPLGGCFGFWGYDLKNHIEPRLPHHATNDLELPDCHLGFYDSLVAFDHLLGKCWIVATGLNPNGTRSTSSAQQQTAFWSDQLNAAHPDSPSPPPSQPSANTSPPTWISNLSPKAFLDAVHKAKQYIRLGHIYQVNLAHRLAIDCHLPAPILFERLLATSPAPFAAFLDAQDFQLVSSSPELFLRISGRHIRTRPIKGTRPRAADPTRDTQLGFELQTSPKEMAELVMITDLLRNDLGRISQFGTVRVPDLTRLERFSHVQHLVSTVEANLRPHVSHLRALAACFPGGSITGAPKIRAMEIIDELEPLARGPYTGALGYIGFNQESQLCVLIRTAICRQHTAWFHVGAGIVADSDPYAEYEETIAKAQGFLAAITPTPGGNPPPSPSRHPSPSRRSQTPSPGPASS